MTKKQSNLSDLLKKDTTVSNGPVGITPRAGQMICGDIDMSIDNHGIWHYEGSPIGRSELIKLFSSVMRRDNIGDHWLITPSEMCRIQVDDAAFMAIELTQEGSGKDQNLTFRTNIDKTYVLSASHPLRIENNPDTGEPAPYIGLDHGIEAKLSRAVFYQLVNLAIEETVQRDKIYGIWSGGHFSPIGSAEEIEAS